ncbi:MAG: transporter substrate-binding domain-containing protein [candidate division NC10 bacterium]|nr:transporter substrate-binding domain-containing protein [candidate division NC10 bacterium]MBI2113913.1 transporter substrate-binding domain-containing protein [candidate division NC10 bacterium]MBI2455313.1 transporter substrate-binding domain-containing protein [candidate division NC10 bacterium]
MRSAMRVLLLAVVVLGLAVTGWAAESTLEKINRTGVFTVGARTGSPPFAYINKQNEWVGFSVDLAKLVHKNIEKKLGKSVKFELKESAPATRIPLLSSMAVDLISGTMTDTRPRRDSVDFSITFFVTGAQFLVKEGSPIKGIQDTAGKRVGAQQGSTNERIIRERVPQAQLVVFPDQPAGFTALVQGRVDTYTNDGIQLAGIKAKAPNPAEWKIVGDFYSYEPYGMAMRKNDSDFRAVVNNALMEAIEGGEYFKLYDKWFGPKGELPYPLTDDVKRFLTYQVVPK